MPESALFSSGFFPNVKPPVDPVLLPPPNNGVLEGFAAALEAGVLCPEVWEPKIDPDADAVAPRCPNTLPPEA